MKNKIRLITLIIIITTLASCDLFTTPESPEPGRRDYVWEEDTIKVPEGYYTNMARIWGSAPDDVWICGISYISDHTIWHYDGEEWCNIDVNRFVTPFAVYGFGKNNVWFGTLESNIWHWDGSELSLYGNYTLPEYNDINIQSMWPNSTEIYAVGYGRNIIADKTVGVIMKYNGTDWNFQNIYEERLTFLDIRKQKSNGVYFVNSYDYGNAQLPYKLFTMQTNRLDLIYESELYISVHDINGKIYFGQHKEIFTYKNNSLELWKDFSNTKYAARLWGRSETDFFTINSDGLGHYNGNDLVTIYKTNYRIENVQLFEKEIFILCEDRETSRDIIIRGKLN